MSSSKYFEVPQVPEFTRMVGMPRLVGLFEAVEGVVDVLLALFLVGGEEALVGREAHQREAVDEGVAFDFLEGGVVGGDELALEDLEAVEAEAGGVFDAGFERAELVAAEAPERVGGNADRVRRLGFRVGLVGAGGGDGGGGGGGGGEEVAAVHGSGGGWWDGSSEISQAVAVR